MKLKKNLEDFKILKKYLKNKKLLCTVYVILVFSDIIPSILGGLIWGFALEALLKGTFEQFLILIILYGGMDVLFNGIISNIQGRIFIHLENEFIRNATKDLYHKINDLPARAFEEKGVGEFINRICHDPEQIVSLLNQLVRLLSRSISGIVALVFAFSLSIVLGIEVLIFAFIMGIYAYKVFPKVKKIQKEIKEETDNYVKTATENLTGIREIKSLGIKNETEKKLFVSVDTIYDRMKKSNIFETNYYSINNALYYMMQTVIYITCGYFVMQGNIAYAMFVTLNTYLWRIDYVVENIGQFGINYNKVVVSLNRMCDILMNRLYQDEKFGTTGLKECKGMIEFKNVKFRYTKEEDDVLKGIQMKLLPNRKIAIVGRSGNGKSTIFNLLLRYFDATEGEILIDGVNIQDLTEDSLRNNISIIRQSPYLFNMSLMDNFRIVKPDITLEEVREVCKKAYIDDYIMSLPDQYETIIGEGGVNLSGGQKQRIAIARTLLLNTKIILFDEATSALDNESQEYIKKTIDGLVKDHTVIIIAHRLSTIIDADEIHVIHGGREIGLGTHQELLETNEVYQKLYHTESLN